MRSCHYDPIWVRHFLSPKRLASPLFLNTHVEILSPNASSIAKEEFHTIPHQLLSYRLSFLLEFLTNWWGCQKKLFTIPPIAKSLFHFSPLNWTNSPRIFDYFFYKIQVDYFRKVRVWKITQCSVIHIFRKTLFKKKAFCEYFFRNR